LFEANRVLVQTRAPRSGAHRPCGRTPDGRPAGPPAVPQHQPPPRRL